jgi:transcription elongation factor GreB
MSKAFTKDDSSNDLVIVPERAPLPPGVPNYVTERGMHLLEQERRQLLAERARLNEVEQDADSDNEEHRKQVGIVNRRLRDLIERISTARMVTLSADAERTVRFGATVIVRTVEGGGPGLPRRIKLVGVDEAQESASLVAFCAPIAKAVLGHRPGERVTRPTGSGDEVLEIVDVEYEAAGAASDPPEARQ